MAWLVSARLGGALGDRFTLVVLPIFAIHTGKASVAQATLLFTLQSLPGLLAIVAGRPFDRARRIRSWCAGADLLRFALLGVVVLMATRGAVTWPVLIVLALVLGTAAMVFDVGLQTYLPRLLPAAHLGAANTWFARVQSIADVLGLPIAGAIVAMASPSLGLGVGAAAFAVSGVLLVAMPLRSHQPFALSAPAPGREGWWAGLPQLIADRTVRPVVLTMLMLNLGGAMIGAVWIVHVTYTLKIPAGQMGLVMAVGGASAFAASVLVGTAMTRYGPLGIVSVPLVLAVAALWCVPLASVGLPILWLGVFQLVFSACAVIIAVSAATLRQRRTPDSLQGRVFAVVRTGQAAVLPVSGLLASAIAAKWGTQAVAVAGAMLATTACVHHVINPRWPRVGSYGG